MNELILLPYIMFSYIFSLLMWGILFITLHYQWKKHDCKEWTYQKWRTRKHFKTKNKVDDSIDWENGV